MKWHERLYKLIIQFTEENEIKNNQLLTFLIVTVYSTLALSDVSDEFAKEIFDKMFEDFKKKKEELNNEN